jgi:hypothetical protein
LAWFVVQGRFPPGFKWQQERYHDQIDTVNTEPALVFGEGPQFIHEQMCINEWDDSATGATEQDSTGSMAPEPRVSAHHPSPGIHPSTDTDYRGM